ncbi:hypothetical protein CNR22_18605 [Sphingobacteriaceae bacterium]|nr:hypothetical protein CNR22_18605 [Sphingobacteriaceae bacterium]
MTDSQSSKNKYLFLDNGGEMGELIKAYDWSQSVLGNPDQWPQSLCTTLGIILHSAFPMFLFWGKDKICFYNDAYRLSLGRDGKHPAIGKKGEEVWDDIWDFIGPLINGVIENGKPVYFEDQLVGFYRNGKKEDIYWTFSYSPAYGDDNQINGVFVTCVETTEKVKIIKALGEGEQEIRALVESAPFPIGVYKGKEMRVALANKSIMDIWGKGSDVVGKLFSEVLPELDNQEVFKQLEEVYITGIPFHIKNQPLDLLVDGVLQKYYFNYSLTPLFNKEGEVYGVMNTGVDLTELNVAKRKIEQSEHNFRNIVLHAPVAMCILLGPTFIVEVANELMIELWGKPVEDVLNKPIFEGLPDAREQGLEDLLTHVYTSGETFKANERPVNLIRFGKEEVVYQNFVYEPYKDAGDKVVGVLAISIDVTDQVLARKKIEEAEGKARLAINSAELGVYEINYSSNEVNQDDRFNEIWGIEGTHSRSEYVARIHPDDLAAREEAHRLSLKTGHLNYQTRVIWKDKSVHWVKISGKVICDDQQIPVKLIGIIQDITDMVIAKNKIEESEKNIRNMILQAPVAMCIFRGPDYTVEIANNMMIGLWGKQAHEVLNKPIFEGLPEAKEQGLEQLLFQVFTTGEKFEANEMAVGLPRHGKIETTYINFVYEALRNGDGSISGILAVAIDVSEQVIARQKIEEVVAERTKELATVNSDLQKSNSELAQFAYIASHDLQEPLRKIGTFSQMLEKSVEAEMSEQSKTYFNKINTSVQRMNSLIRDVLAYSEVTKTGDLIETVDLNKIFESIKTDYDLLIEQTGANVSCNTLPVLQAIPLQMSQLFGNLIGNALKFIRKDTEPRIRIFSSELTRLEKTALGLPKDLLFYKIEFKDNGVGFKPEYAAQIFHIFQRLHRKSEFEGTGIGLALCKKIVLNHHGIINADGSSENGAVFNVILPATQLR